MCDGSLFAISHITVGFFFLRRLCSVRIFGNIFLKGNAGKIDTAVFNILDIGNLTIILGSVKGCYADSQNLCRLFASNQLFPVQPYFFLITE